LGIPAALDQLGLWRASGGRAAVAPIGAALADISAERRDRPQALLPRAEIFA
jgi:hypothetical protein